MSKNETFDNDFDIFQVHVTEEGTYRLGINKNVLKEHLVYAILKKYNIVEFDNKINILWCDNEEAKFFESFGYDPLAFMGRVVSGYLEMTSEQALAFKLRYQGT